VAAAHKTRTNLEAEICAELDRQGVAHAHRVLQYRVRMKTGKAAPYRPAISAHRGPLLFLVEPCLSYTPGGGAVVRHARFLEQHSPDIVLILVAPGTVADRLPPESYDEVYTDADVPTLVSRIRDQDPAGPLKPFAKRR
jgi:hypothetical protein